MSADTQRTLDDYEPAPVEDDPSHHETDGARSVAHSAASWTPEDPGLRECLGCGAHVSTEFARVLGDNDGRVWGCTTCCNNGELARGAAGDPHHDDRVTGGKR